MIIADEEEWKVRSRKLLQAVESSCVELPSPDFDMGPPLAQTRLRTSDVKSTLKWTALLFFLFNQQTPVPNIQ